MRARLVSLALGLCVMASPSANAGLVPERVEKAARERIAAGYAHLNSNLAPVRYA